MDDHNDQDNVLDFEVYELNEFMKQNDQKSGKEDKQGNENKNKDKQKDNDDDNDNSKDKDDSKQRKVKVESKQEIISFNPNDAIAQGGSIRVITTEKIKNNPLNTSNTQIQSKVTDESSNYKNTPKVRKLQTEYTEYQETQQALKEFQDKEYQFRFIIDNFIQLNNEKQYELEQCKQSLIKIQNNRYISVDKSDPLLHINNNNNLRVFANKKVNKFDEYYPKEIEVVRKELQGKIKQKVERVKEEEFYTKTLRFMEQRLILEKEQVQKVVLEYEQLNEAVEKNITYLEEDEKETIAENYTKKAMNHIEDIHKTVMQKTLHLQQLAESNLKSQIHGYKDIKESIVEARELLQDTQNQIQILNHQNILKLRQQQELDSLIDHLGDFNMLANTFIYDDPQKHFTHQLSYEPQIDFSDLIDDDEEKMKNTSQLNNSNYFEDKRESYNLLSNDKSVRYTLKILKQKNLMLYALKVKKKLTEIKNEMDGDETKAQFIVNILNQFYEAHNNNIPYLFDQISTSYSNQCKESDGLSNKVVRLEFEKKKYQELLKELSNEVIELKDRYEKKKKNLTICEVEKEQEIQSYNLMISQNFKNDKFIEDYLSQENNTTDIHQLLKANEIFQQPSALNAQKDAFDKNFSTFLNSSHVMLSKVYSLLINSVFLFFHDVCLHDKVQNFQKNYLNILSKFFSLLNQIRDRGDGQNKELNDLVDESLMFLRGWKVQSKEIDTTSRYLIIQEIKQVDLKYIMKNIISEKNILDCLTIDIGGNDCMFGILKIFERIFKDKYTIRQICERIINNESKKLPNPEQKRSLRQNIERAYNSLNDASMKRCKNYFLEMLESHLFIQKYITKVQLIKYINDVKQQYDQDLEEYLLNNQDFKEGNQKINLDENHVIRLLQQNHNILYDKANARAKEWIYDIMSLFKKVLMVVLKRKSILSNQLGLVDQYDEFGQLQQWYDPVSAFNSKQFDSKLNTIMNQVQIQRSQKVQNYLGKPFESTADTFQCATFDTQIPIPINCKANIFNIVKQQLDYVEVGEPFINIQEDLKSFEDDRKQIKRIMSQIYRRSSSNDENQDRGSISTSNLASNKSSEKIQSKQRPFSAVRGDSNKNDLSKSKSNTSSNCNKNKNGLQQISNGVVIKTNNQRNSLPLKPNSGLQKKQDKGRVSNAGDETAASLEDLPSKELNKTENKKQSVKERNNPALDFALSGSDDIKKKIMMELTKEIKTADKQELKSVIQHERNKIVHQQSEYRKTRDQYIKEKEFEDLHQKLENEMDKQILILQQQQQSNAYSEDPELTDLLNNQSSSKLKHLQSKFQQHFINNHKSLPNSFQTKKSAALQSFQLQQTQLQTLQAAFQTPSSTNAAQNTFGSKTTQGFLSGTASSKANKIPHQKNNQNQSNSQGKRKRETMVEMMKNKYDEKQNIKLKSLQKVAFAYGDFNNLPNSNSDPTLQKHNKHQNSSFQLTNEDQFKVVKFETVVKQITGNSNISLKKSLNETGLTTQQINKLKRENLFLQHLEKDSLEQQFVKLNKQIQIQEKFNKMYHNSSSSQNNSLSPNQNATRFQNAVKKVKIFNEMFQNQINEQNKDQNNAQLSPAAVVANLTGKTTSRNFQIRSYSPTNSQGSTSKNFTSKIREIKNKQKEESKSLNNSTNNLKDNLQSKQQKGIYFNKDKSKINISSKHTKKSEEKTQKILNTYLKPGNIQQQNKNKLLEDQFKIFQQNTSASSQINTSNSYIEENAQKQLFSDLNRYFNKNNYF